MIWIVVAVVALAAAVLTAEAGATTAPPAAAQTSGTIIHALPGPQVFPESVAVDAASGRFWVTSVKDGTIFTGVVGSASPVLWRARRTRDGYHLQRFLDFTGTPVRYRTAPGAAGINVNGIATSADGHDLVIGKRNDNALFHVDVQTKRVRRIALPAGAVTTPDGIVLRGRTLYVVQNTPSAVQVLRVSRDYTTAAVRGTITDPSFAFTTGAAIYRDRLLVVSSQFDTLGSPAAVTGTAPPTLPFWVSEVAAGTP